MAKALKPYRGYDITVSFDAAAFIKAATKVAADLANGRITPAEARALNAEHRDALKRVELILK